MPNNLPPNWPWVKLGNVCEVVRGGSPRPMGDPKYFVGDIPFIKISDITKDDSKFVSDSHTKVNEAGVKKSRLLQKGSLILSNSGSVCIPKFLAIDACIHDGFVSFLNFRTEVDLNFLYHFFNYTRPYVIQKHKQGITQVNLNTTIVSEFEIPLPPLPEQQKIVEKIEELFSGLDSGVASLKKAKEQIRLYRQSVLASAFSGNLLTPSAERIAQSEMLKAAEPKVEYKSQLPEGWKWVKLGEIIKVSSGKGLTSANMFTDGLYPVYGGNGVSGYYNDFLFEEPRLIIGRVGAKCGVIHITKPKSWVTDNALIVDFTSNNVEMKFLYHCLDYHNLNKLSVSTAQPVISGTKIYPYEIMLPPLKQQTKIVEEIEKRFSEADNLEKAIDESLAKSETLRQSILKKAFEGKLV